MDSLASSGRFDSGYNLMPVPPKAKAKIRYVRQLAERIKAGIKAEETRLLWFDRFTKYPPPVKLAEIIGDVLRQEPEPLDDGTAGLLIKYLGPIGGPELGMVAAEWMIEAGWPTINRIHIFNSVLILCERSWDLQNAFRAYDMMKNRGIAPNVFTFNLLISTSRLRGVYEKAFEVYEEMVATGVVPNTFTYTTLIEACNYRKAGHCEPALYAFQALLNSGIEPPDFVRLELLSTIENGCARSNLQGATEVFEGLEKVGMSNNTRAFNAVLNACAREGEWIAALEVFENMKHRLVPADTGTYNAILNACMEAGQAEKALEVFEWMVEGRGASGPVAADTATYNALISVCERNGMLEKALEIYAWMQGSGVAPDSKTYDRLMGAVDVAQKWDDNVSTRTPADNLRPAPFDGMRIIYMQQYGEKEEDERLAEVKLAQPSWAPTSMRSPPAPDFWADFPMANLDIPLADEVLQSSQTVTAAHSRATTAAKASRQSTANTPVHNPIPWARNAKEDFDSRLLPSGHGSRWKPPPLSAKEMVLAAQRGVNTNRYRLNS